MQTLSFTKYKKNETPVIEYKLGESCDSEASSALQLIITTLVFRGFQALLLFLVKMYLSLLFMPDSYFSSHHNFEQKIMS